MIRPMRVGIRSLRNQETAQSGTKHIEREDSYQGNRDSNSNASKEGVSYSQEQVAIGIDHAQPNTPSSPTNPVPSNRNSNPSNPKQSAGAARAKAATEHIIEQHLQAVRALAAAGIDVGH